MKLTRRAAAWLLIAAILLLCVPTAFATAGTPIYNRGTRGELCTALSEQALAYYVDGYDYDTLQSLPGAKNTATSYAATQNNALYDALYELMSSTQTEQYNYSSLRYHFAYTDSEADSPDGQMTCIWTGRSAKWNGEYYNREHVWPKSRASFYQINGGADRHHLRPASATINQDAHWNRPYGSAQDGTAAYGETGLLGGWYSDSYYEPIDSAKGDTARILLYVYVRWQQPNLYSNVPLANLPEADSDDMANNGLRVIADLETLLSWCALDPVDTWEMQRNDAVECLQGNRNVFIDYPELAWLLFGEDIPHDLQTPSGEAQNATYRLSAESNNSTYGTVTLTDNVITAYPNNGYTVDEAQPVTVTPDGAATVTRTGDFEFAVTEQIASCKVTVNFTPISCEHAHTQDEHKAPTCTETGYDRVVCTDCGTVLSETTLKKTAHDYQETLVAPTCTEKGYTLYECSRCHAGYKKKYTPALGHTEVIDEAVAATCTESGLTEGKHCSVCGEIFVAQETVEALGHNYVDGTCTHCGADDPSYEPFDPTEEFTDIPSNAWYLDSVAFAVKNGLMNGMGNGEFQPDEPTTRAMVVTILYRLSGSEEKCENPFTDVLDNVWYTDAVAWAYQNGVVKGMSETTFEPDTKMNREMLAVILYRYTNSIAPEKLTKTADLAAFPDSADVSFWATDALQWAVANGIINGNVLDGQTYLQPQANATRAQVAAIFQRYLENVLNK